MTFSNQGRFRCGPIEWAVRWTRASVALAVALIIGASPTAIIARTRPAPQTPTAPQTPDAPQTPAAPAEEASPRDNPPTERVDQPNQDPAPAVSAAPAVESATERGPRVQKYLELRKAMRDLDNQINNQLTSVSPAVAEYKTTVEQLKQLRQRKGELNQEILEASVEAYLEAPDKYREINDDLTKLMRALLGEQGSGTRFEPEQARAIAERLISARTKNLNIYFYGSYAAYCLNDFPQSRIWLQPLLDAGAKPEQTILKQIDDAAGKWDRESKLREADAETKVPQVAIETSLGELVVELFENEAPNTVANFIYLVEKKYYDGSFICLSQPGRLVIAGCTRGDGLTNAGYYIPDEVDRPELRHHFAGALAMTTEGPNTGSARFTILQQPTPSADGKLTVFGRVISGMNVIYGVPPIKPTDIRLGAEPVKIVSMRVLRKQTHPYEPKTIPLPAGDKSGK